MTISLITWENDANCVYMFLYIIREIPTLNTMVYTGQLHLSKLYQIENFRITRLYYIFYTTNHFLAYFIKGNAGRHVDSLGCFFFIYINSPHWIWLEIYASQVRSDGSSCLYLLSLSKQVRIVLATVLTINVALDTQPLLTSEKQKLLTHKIYCANGG